MPPRPGNLCAVLLILAAYLTGCHQSDDSKPKTTPGSAPLDEIALPVDSPKRGYIKEAVVELVQRPLLEPLAGKIVYDENQTVRVRSPIAGRVLKISASLGAIVRKGDVLLELDSPELGQAQADYQDALADLKLSEANYRRTRELFDRGIVARKEFEQFQDSLTRARVEVERSRLRLVNLGVSGDRTDNRFILHAPIGGAVTEFHVNPGMEVRPDTEAPLFILSDISSLWLLLDVYEKDIAVIHTGQHVALTVPAYPGEIFPATVETIGKVVDETTRTVKVRCRLPNPHGKLLPAMYATVDVQSDKGDLALVVPLTAIYTEGESDWLFAALGDGRYKKTEVAIGFRMKDRAVIDKGLSPGQRIVVEGALLLRSEEDNVEQTGEGPR